DIVELVDTAKEIQGGGAARGEQSSDVAAAGDAIVQDVVAGRERARAGEMPGFAAQIVELSRRSTREIDTADNATGVVDLNEARAGRRCGNGEISAQIAVRL